MQTTKPIATIGIDPGKAGSLCLLAQDGGTIVFRDWPKSGDLADYYERISRLMRRYDIIMCILERVHAMPKQGVSSTFSFGVNFGIWQGWLTTWQHPHMLVPPQTWMKGLTSKADGRNTKQQICSAARRMFPQAELMGPRGGILDGRADSLMMAYYAMLMSAKGGIIRPQPKPRPARRS